MKLSRSLALLAWLPAIAFATSLKDTTIAERTQLADRVVRAQVVSTETKLPGNGDVRRMMTWTKLKILDQYKGTGPAEIDLLQLGGRSGLWEAHVPGDATFDSNEQVVLFLRCKDASHPERCTLVGFKTGKLRQMGADDLLQESLNRPPERQSLKALIAEVKKAGGAR
ncbi:MAG: hypothetical protein ACJ790_09985 [Myxococcaceae bacterium]